MEELKNSLSRTMKEGVDNKFCELSSDLLKLLFTTQNPLQMRLICRSMREKVENYPDFVIHLSPDGTKNASSTFFARFKGNISVGSRHGWDPVGGWFSSLIEAIRQGMQVDTIFPLAANSLNLPQFSAKLNEVCLKKIQKLSISFCGTTKSLSSSMEALSALCNVAVRVELELDVLFRRPKVVLLDAVQQVRGLGGAINLQSLKIR
jgi:hypothetical protein